MNFDVEPWRKLYIRRDAKWLSLPVSARGLADELLKYADDDGRVFIGSDPAGMAVSYMMSARPNEHQRIADDIKALLDDGYIVLRERYLVIRNFRDAQSRHKSTARVQRFRERASKKAQEKPADDSSVTFHERFGNGFRNAQSETETKRNEENKPPNPLSGERTKRSKPESAHAQYAQAYADGIAAASGEPFTPPRAGKWEFIEMAKAYARAKDGTPLGGDLLLAWFRAVAKDYRIAMADSAAFQSGFSPKACHNWLKAGKPSGAQQKLGAVQPLEPQSEDRTGVVFTTAKPPMRRDPPKPPPDPEETYDSSECQFDPDFDLEAS